MSFLRLFRKNRTKPETKVSRVEILDFQTVEKMFILASQELNEHETFLNKINVFPVADGDTGSNMVHTVNAVGKELEFGKFNNLQEIGKNIVRTSTLNSRGNSGTIISQFFKGFCSNFKDKDFLNSKDIIQSFKIAKEESFKSFEEPKEGTVLDTIKAAYNGAKSQRNSKNILKILDSAIQESQVALEKTKKIMPQMRKANVVDSGAAGFVYILIGFLSALKKTKIVTTNTKENQGIGIIEENHETFRYCTEFLLSDPTTSGKEIRKEIRSLGDSLQVVEIDDIVKIHIHTDHPEKIKLICKKYGCLEKIKIDDLFEEQKERLQKGHKFFKNDELKKKKSKVAIVTDASADIPEHWFEKYPIEIAKIPIFLPGGDQEDVSSKYTRDEFYEKMETIDSFIPKTAQTSTQDYKKVFEKTLQNCENIICVPISSGLSGGYQSALRAKEMMDEGSNNISILDLKSISCGISIAIKEFFKNYEKNKNIDSAISRLYNIKDNIKTYFLVDNVKYLERGGRINKATSVIGQLLNIKPLLKLEKGIVEKDGDKLVFGNDKKAIELLFKKLKKAKRIDNLFVIFSGKKGEKNAQLLIKKIKNELNVPASDIEKTDLNLVIGCHVGPGALGVIFA